MGCGQSKAVDVAKGNAVVQRVLRRRLTKNAEKQIDASQANEKNPRVVHEESKTSEEPSSLALTDEKNTLETSPEWTAGEEVSAGAKQRSLPNEDANSDKLVNGSSLDGYLFPTNNNNGEIITAAESVDGTDQGVVSAVDEAKNGLICGEGEKQEDAGQVSQESLFGSDGHDIIKVQEELVAQEFEDEEHHGGNNIEESLSDPADHERQEEQGMDECAEEREEEKMNETEPMELDQEAIAAEETKAGGEELPSANYPDFVQEEVAIVAEETEVGEEEVPSADQDFVQEDVETSRIEPPTEEDHHSGAGDGVVEEAEEIRADLPADEEEKEVDNIAEEVQESDVDPLSHEDETEVAASVAAASEVVQNDAEESADVHIEATAAGDELEVEESNVVHVL